LTVRADKPHEYCGVLAIHDPTRRMTDAARAAYFGLFALQHRGQESAGIAVNREGSLFCHKDKGLVVEVFQDMTLNLMTGHAAIGHVRYPMQGDHGVASAQPMVIDARGGPLALGHNGSLVNAEELRLGLEAQGAIFETGSDAELLLTLLARHRITTRRLEDAVQRMMADVRGAYALTILAPDRTLGVRDPLGIRPLCLGRVGEAYVLASESCAIDAMGGEFLRDVDPGEIVTISADGLASETFHPAPVQLPIPGVPAGADVPASVSTGGLCLFEFVYFARPDSFLDGASVYESRLAAGQALAAEHPADADLVIGAPDSGIVAAIGYSRRSGIPYGSGLLKNRYVGRTFIQPTAGERESMIGLKFSALRTSIEGKRLVMVDDSIIRGQTTRRIVALLKDAGAREVHVRIASPPVMHPCFYGVDISTWEELSAAEMSIDRIRAMIGADSLGYLGLDGLRASTRGLCGGLCASCFDGTFPAGVPTRRLSEIRVPGVLKEDS
jgi:amidophosphoribosyltransferase